MVRSAHSPRLHEPAVLACRVSWIFTTTEATGAQAKRAFTSHTDWITAAAWHPASPHHLATASFDRTVKLWDLRALMPLHTLAAHTDKALAVSWAGPARLASGGADGALRMFAVSLSGP